MISALIKMIMPPPRAEVKDAPSGHPERAVLQRATDRMNDVADEVIEKSNRLLQRSRSALGRHNGNGHNET